MTRMTTMAVPLALLAGAALAQEATPALPDANGDGVWSLEELQVSVPDLTAEVFATIDANADGSVDTAELDAAIAAGSVKPAT